MPASKHIALNDFLSVDGTDISNDCRAINPVSEFALIDDSGFSVSGGDENLVGSRASSLTATVFDTTNSRGVLWYAHVNRAIVPLIHRKDQNNPVGADNPQLAGNVYVRTYSPSRTRGDVATHDVEFVAADSTGLVWSYS